MTSKLLVVGLTGGIGSGKTTVSNFFRALGAPVIDADEVSRELVEPGSPVLQTIVQKFGTHLVDRDGRLRRAILRQLIFEDSGLRSDLEAILHPAIRQRMREKLASLDAEYVIMAIPLLVETGQQDLVDRVLVVDTPESVQIERVLQRDQNTEEQVRKILASQATPAQRLQAANDVIHNDGNLDSLNKSVVALHEKYLQLSRAD